MTVGWGFGFATTGDVWLIDDAGERVLRFKFDGGGAAIGGVLKVGASFSRQYGVVELSSTPDMLGWAGNGSIELTVGLGAVASAGVNSSSFNVTGGWAVGLSAGYAGGVSKTAFYKSYRDSEVPVLGVR